MKDFTFEEQLDASSQDEIRTILASANAFSSREIEVATELVRENLEKGSIRSGYFFLLARDKSGRMAGFTCFGPIPCTVHSYDLYWIAVYEDCRGMGLGGNLYLKTEAQVKKRGGKKIYAETSGREDYRLTRNFYQGMGFKELCRLEEFYAPGDDKVIYGKTLNTIRTRDTALRCPEAG